MLGTLINNPETLAHWIVLLPILSFAIITLKLVINTNAPFPIRFRGTKKEETEPSVEMISVGTNQEKHEPESRKQPNFYLNYLWLLIFLLLVFLALAVHMGSLGQQSAATSQAQVPGWLVTLREAVTWLLVLFVFAWPWGARKWAQKWGPHISVISMGLASIIATSLWIKMVTHHDQPWPTDTQTWHQVFHFTWYKIGDWNLDIGIRLDGFAVFAVWMVTVVATCIQWFSLGYMWDDAFGRKHIGRYFAFHSLFAVGMLLVVLSDNILTFLIGWEIMGLCSYLLIGFFTYKPSANAAQLKAFITTRIGDVGFMLGIFLLGLMYVYTKNPVSFNFDKIQDVVVRYDWWAANMGWLPTAAALLIFMGAVGKSAQFPLHVWLPDAMEGPTPVSALIHAATMVAAGVFLVARFFWLFELSSTAMLTVAWIGAITAFGAATIGVVQYDIKRILAYSTISQLGYMMIALGVGAVSASMFHLLTHAYFKALLFLGSGAVIYGCRHIQDIRYMGGLSKRMPITYWTFLIGTLALAGMVPFAGFWSKDEVLTSAYEFAMKGHERTIHIGDQISTLLVVHPNPFNLIIFILAVAGAFLTAFYMFRLMSYVFLSGPHSDFRYRANECPDQGHHPSGEIDTKAYASWPVPPGPFDKHGHSEEAHCIPCEEPKEVPMSMWIPLVILAAFSTLYGFIGMPFLGEKNLIAKFLHHAEEHIPEVGSLTYALMGMSLVVVIAGIYFGLRLNNTEQGVAIKRRWKASLPGLYRTIYNKYFIDEFYEEYIIEPVLMIAQAAKTFDNYVVDGIVNAAGWLTYMFSMFQGWWDNKVVDGLVNAMAWVVGFLSDSVKPIQSGYVQNYMMIIIFFVLLYLLSLFIHLGG
jgi:NADH-quinone oxidoreductase subunit L